MDPPTPIDHYSILGIGNDATPKCIEDAFYGLVGKARQYSQHEALDRAGRSQSTGMAGSSRNQDFNGMPTRQFSIHQMQITKAYEVLSDPVLRTRYDKSTQPVVRAKSLRLRRFSAWERRTSDGDALPEVTFAGVKQKLKEKLKKGKERLEAVLETTAHKVKEAEARQKSRWPEVLATPQAESFYQQPAMPRPQIHQPQKQYYAEEQTPTTYEDFHKTPKDYQVRDRAATTDVYTRNSHIFNEAVEPRELKMRSPPNRARLVTSGRQPGCMDNGPHGWKGWHSTNKCLAPPGCPICEEFGSKFFCTKCNATTCMMCRLV